MPWGQKHSSQCMVCLEAVTFGLAPVARHECFSRLAGSSLFLERLLSPSQAKPHKPVIPVQGQPGLPRVPVPVSTKPQYNKEMPFFFTETALNPDTNVCMFSLSRDCTAKRCLPPGLSDFMVQECSPSRGPFSVIFPLLLLSLSVQPRL